MPVNKFGASLERSGYAESRRPSVESLRGYVRDNALCLNQSDYDARERKIRRVAAPETDTDAANKSYVEVALRNAREENRAFRESTANDITRLDNRVDLVVQTLTSLIQFNDERIKGANNDIRILKEALEKFALQKSTNAVEAKITQLTEEHKRPSTRARPTQKDRDKDRDKDREKDKNKDKQ